MDGALVGTGTLWRHNLTLVFYILYNLLFGRKARFIYFYFYSLSGWEGLPHRSLHAFSTWVWPDKLAYISKAGKDPFGVSSLFPNLSSLQKELLSICFEVLKIQIFLSHVNGV